MKPSTLLAVAMGAPIVSADYMCPAHKSKTDIPALKFGYKVQALLESYYNMIPVNATFFKGLPMADQKGMNGDTMAENTVANVMGLTKQAELGAKAIVESVKSITGDGDMMPPKCNYNFPPTPDGMTHLKHAYFLEASMCGAFIGLADYVQSPEAAFLMARLAAEHGIHASALRGQMQDVGFHDNSTSLTPAFTPETVMMKSDDAEVGKLGKWLNGCTGSIYAPCRGKLMIGDLGAKLTDQMSSEDDGDDDHEGCDSMQPSPTSEGQSTPTSGMGGNGNDNGDDDDGDDDNDGDNNNDDGDNSGMPMPTPSQIQAGAGRNLPTAGMVSVIATVFAMLM